MYPHVTQFEWRDQQLALRLLAAEAAHEPRPKRRRRRRLSLRPRLARA